MALFVVTGGTGFLGTTLVSQLRSNGHRVIIASRERKSDIDCNDWIDFDLQNQSTVENIVNIKPDGVFHLAWSTTPATAEQAPASDVSVNLAGSLNLLDKLAAVVGGRVVLVSSGGAIYGPSGPEPISELHPTQPISIYGATKLALEQYSARCKIFAPLDIRIARVSNPFGVNQAFLRMQGAATLFARKIIKGEEIEIWGDGLNVRDYIDVDDVARGLIAIMSIDDCRSEGAEIFNIGSGEGLTLVDLISHLEFASGLKADIRFVENRAFDVRYNILDISKIRSRTGWYAGGVRDRLVSLVSQLRNYN